MKRQRDGSCPPPPLGENGGMLLRESEHRAICSAYLLLADTGQLISLPIRVPCILPYNKLPIQVPLLQEGCCDGDLAGMSHCDCDCIQSAVY